MKKILGAVVSVGAFVILVAAASAQMEQGSGHDMHKSKGEMSKGGHHETMKNHMSKAAQEMKSHSKAGHGTKSHAGKAGHDMKSHAGKAGHE